MIAVNSPESLRRAAKLLSGDPATHTKIISALVAVVTEIQTSQRDFEQSGGRAVVREKLTKLAVAAGAVAKLLADKDLADFRGMCLARGLGDWSPNVNSDRVRSLADDAIFICQEIPTKAGAISIADVKGFPRGRHICAVATLILFELAYGRPPNKKNMQAQTFCAELWNAAAGRVSRKVHEGEVNDIAAWERHLADARKPANVAASLSARLRVQDIITDARLGDIFPPKNHQLRPRRGM